MCVQDGVETVLRRYGMFIATLGGALRIVRSSEEIADVCFLSRGQLLQAKLASSAKYSAGAHAVLQAMIAAMLEAGGDFVLASVIAAPPSREEKVALFRTKLDGFHALRRECTEVGCRSHDEFCWAAGFDEP
jgi:hypothetical protein